MRLGIVIGLGHKRGTDPVAALRHDRALVAAARERVSAVVLQHRLGGGEVGWTGQALTYASFLAADAGSLAAVVRGIPLGVLNPVELAEQLATADHAWAGRLSASVTRGSDRVAMMCGIDPSASADRCIEALAVVRSMWALRPFEASGKHFRFPLVRPTLGPRQSHGPRLSFEATDADAAVYAARHGLGLHVIPGGVVDPVVAAYRTSGGRGMISASIDESEASAAALASLQEAGIDHLDVRLRRDDVGNEAGIDRLDALVARADAAMAR